VFGNSRGREGGRRGGATHRDTRVIRCELELSKHPYVVDELEGGVQQLLAWPTHVDRPTGDGEDIVCLKFLLYLVCGAGAYIIVTSTLHHNEHYIIVNVTS